MRWRPYNGPRIAAPGMRTFVEKPAKSRFGATTKRYGCVWPTNGAFGAYVERHHPGEVEDVELGTFESERAAKSAVVGALACD